LRQNKILGQDNEVVSVTKTIGGEGKGFLAQVWILKLAYKQEDKDLPSSLAAKVASKTIYYSLFWAIMRLFDEMHFYKVMATESLLKTPNTLYVEANPWFGQGLLLMEDLVAKNATFTNTSLKPFSVEQMQGLIVQVARHHAKFWDKKKNYKALCKSLPKNSGLKLADGSTHNFDCVMAALLKQGAPKMAKLTHLLNQDTIEIMQKLGRPGHWIKMRDYLNANYPCTMIHGDFRAANMALLPDGSYRFFDFQLASYRPGIVDVSWVVHFDMETEERIKHEQELVQFYIKNLVENGVPQNQCQYEDLWHVFQVCKVWYSTFICVFALANLDPSNSEGAKIFKVACDRANVYAKEGYDDYNQMLKEALAKV